MREERRHKRVGTAGDDPEWVLRVTREVSASLGSDFFQSLVKRVAEALAADCVYIAEVCKGPVNRIQTLAVCLNGVWAENFEQDLPNTVCAQVLAAGSFAYAADVRELFPEDASLERLQAQAYVGCRLSDSDGRVLGVLAAVYGRRLQLADVDLAKSVLEVFTQRAAAQLERKRDYDALREANERHRAFIEGSTDAMWRIELEKPVPVNLDEDEQIELIYRYGYVAECNTACARLLGARSAEDVIGARFSELVPRTDTRLVEELRESIRAGYRDERFEVRHLDAQGRQAYRLRSRFGIVENGALQRVWGTSRDITDLRRTERALESSERRCHEMIERLPLPAVVVDSAGHIHIANEALLRLGAWERESLFARNWYEVFADQESRERWKAALEYRGSGPTSARLETHVLCAGGKPRLISWETSLLLDPEGKVEGIAAVGTDVTSQKAVEAQILQAQKLEGIARMAAAVAHDFNNLLTVVIGHTSHLLSEIDELHPMRRILSDILASARQCGGLIEQLLAVGGKQRLRLSVFDLNSAISGAESVIRTLVGEQIRLDLQLESSLRPVTADPAQIERVLTNLAANARDAMPSGGTLVIATSNADLDEKAVSAIPDLKPGPYVRLTVTDDGVGMSEEVQARIFDPFYSTKPPGRGTGLGLSTVYGIVRQSGGIVSVQSEPGHGTCFTILLPAARVPEE